MNKLIALFVALVLAVMPAAVFAETVVEDAVENTEEVLFEDIDEVLSLNTEESAEEEEVVVETGEEDIAVETVEEEIAVNPLDDEAYREELAGNAKELLTIMAAGSWGDGFEGAPDANSAWSALSGYLKDSAEDEQLFTDAELASCYADLFAEGEFHDIAQDFEDTCFEEAEGGYRYMMADGDPSKEIIINSTDTYTEDALFCDVSVYSLVHDEYPMYFVGNFTAILVPCEDAPYGALCAGWIPQGLPSFPAAESDAQLNDQEGNTYAAMNVMDDDLKTCWAYPLSKTEDPMLTLLADEPQQVRGVVVTPGYAKSEYAFTSNRRVAQLRVTLSDNEFIFDLEDVDKEDFEGTYILPFDGVYTTDSVVIEVVDTYDGSKFDDVCISEIYLF